MAADGRTDNAEDALQEETEALLERIAAVEADIYAQLDLCAAQQAERAAVAKRRGSAQHQALDVLEHVRQQRAQRAADASRNVGAGSSSGHGDVDLVAFSDDDSELSEGSVEDILARRTGGVMADPPSDLDHFSGAHRPDDFVFMRFGG